MASSDAAEFISVSKSYSRGGLARGRQPAVAGVSLRVEADEVLGLVGPNRAGKTTLVKLLLGLCRPDQGHVERLGRPTSDRRTLARVGYVHEEPAFPKYLSAAAVLDYYGGLSGVPDLLRRRRVRRLLERFGLADRASEPISRFSKGMVRRLGLAQALVNEPDLLILDEPCEGLDLGGRRLVDEVVRETREAGKAVVLISHALSDIERLCDRVAVLVEGRLERVGPVATLRGPSKAGRPPRRALEESLAPLFAGAER